MTEKQRISAFLDIKQPMSDNPIRISMLSRLLRGARSLSGRSVITGKYLKKEFNVANFEKQTYQPFQFMGVMSYLIFLEQIGSVFRPKGNTRKTKRGILEALSHFSNMDDKKALAIYSLRCSLSHNFGLATENTRPDKFKFTLSIDRNEDIVTLGNWDGAFTNRSETTLTTIYIHDLIDLIENIYNSICKDWKDDKLEMLYSGKIDEFETRFTISH